MSSTDQLMDHLTLGQPNSLTCVCALSRRIAFRIAPPPTNVSSFWLTDGPPTRRSEPTFIKATKREKASLFSCQRQAVFLYGISPSIMNIQLRNEKKETSRKLWTFWGQFGRPLNLIRLVHALLWPKPASRWQMAGRTFQTIKIVSFSHSPLLFLFRFPNRMKETVRFFSLSVHFIFLIFFSPFSLVEDYGKNGTVSWHGPARDILFRVFLFRGCCGWTMFCGLEINLTDVTDLFTLLDFR